MKEENRGASNKSWRRIFKKKWFYPALYLTLAAFLLTAVVWYQSLDNQLKDVVDDQNNNPESEDFQPTPHDEDATSVIEQQEIIKMPVVDQELAEIVTKFYDYNASQEDRVKGLTRYNNSYYQSKGIDITHVEEKEFDVKAALSGTVEEVKTDPLLGNVVTLKHQNDVVTYYASLGKVSVDAGAKVKQGETIGTAGKNLFGKDNGTHVHFQIRKDNQEVDPEAYFNQSVSKLDEIGTEVQADEQPDEPEDKVDETEDDPDEDRDGEAPEENNELQ